MGDLHWCVGCSRLKRLWCLSEYYICSVYAFHNSSLPVTSNETKVSSSARVINILISITPYCSQTTHTLTRGISAWFVLICRTCLRATVHQKDAASFQPSLYIEPVLIWWSAAAAFWVFTSLESSADSLVVRVTEFTKLDEICRYELPNLHRKIL